MHPLAEQGVQKSFWIWTETRQMLRLGSEKLYAVKCLLACCLLAGGSEGLGFTAMPHFF